MDVDEVLARRRSPVAEEHVLDVFGLERLAQERIVVKINLPDGEIIGGTPVGVDLAKQIG